jgi:signal transduction histidine kinase
MGTITELVPGEDATAGRGGEMGARIRAFDWASTPLGPLERWPQSLRLSLGIVLDAEFAMALSWGPELVMLYNDPCRSIFAAKHPAALGRSTRETFSEMWGLVGPIYERVIEHGEPTYTADEHTPFDRHGYLEEAYFTASNSAIRDESGQVGGVLSTFVETTDRVLAARRLGTVRDLGAAAVEASSRTDACAAAVEILGRNPLDVPFAILYLADEAGAVAHRAGLCGLPPDHRAAPRELVLAGGGEPGWPLREVARDGAARFVGDADRRFGVLECGPWPEKPRSALVLPMRRPGQGHAIGFVVAGISARRVLDPIYQDFFQMVAGHVSAAVHTAMAREDERRRAEALSALDRAKTLFFSDISHEFRTPLTLILGPLEQLEAELGPALTPAARELIETAQRNGLRLRKLVDTVLDFAHIEAGRVEAALEPVDLAALTGELAGMFRSTAERAGLRLRVDCPPLPEPVYVDPEMWEKVVLNLLSNALKFTFEGEIAVALRAAEEGVELAVRDTGVGIPAEELPRLFDRFHRVRGVRARSHEGSGIGLALVSELVRLHGGAVRVESVVDAGTTLTVSLPRGAAHVPPDRVRRGQAAGSPRTRASASLAEAALWVGAPAGPAARAGSRDGRARARVLVVDDNADMRGYIARLLTLHHEVETCADGTAGAEAARRRRPDLVLSDVMMPGADGFHLLRELRGDRATSTVPVILLSARAGEEATLEGLAAGADDYLVKPFSARELTARIDAQLAMARLRQHRAAAAERNRIGRELHDSVTQTLIAATVLAEELTAPAEMSPEALAGEVRSLARITRGAMAEMRVLLTEMRPEIVERARIGHLVRQLADAVRGRMQVDVSVRVEDTGSEALPGDVRAAVYRIAQESLNNVVKHSRARSVEVALAATSASVELSVRDDGVGFAPGASPTGMGLPGMQERADIVGAALRIRGLPGSGTEVALLWPGAADGQA